MNKRQFLSWVGTFAVAAIATGCGPKSGDTGTSGTSGTNGAAGNASSAGATNSAGTSASAAGAPGAFEVQKATVGYLQNIVMPQPLIGIQEGAFAKAMPGVSFSGQSFPAGPAVMESLQSGKVDIAYTGPYPPLKAFIKNKDIVLLVAAGAGGTELLVGGKSGVKSVKDLKGKVVGVNQLGSTVDAMVRHVLIENGLKPEVDVKIIKVEPAEQAEALKSGDVAAASAPAPWPTVAKQAGATALLDWKQILDGGKYLQGVAFTTKKFADANPNFVRAFVQAHRTITDDLNKNRAAGDKRVLAAWEKDTGKTMKPAVAAEAFKTITFTNESTIADWNRVQDIAAEVGILRKKGELAGFLYEAK